MPGGMESRSLGANFQNSEIRCPNRKIAIAAKNRSKIASDLKSQSALQNNRSQIASKSVEK